VVFDDAFSDGQMPCGRAMAQQKASETFLASEAAVSIERLVLPSDAL
jgi:hypothetical protein